MCVCVCERERERERERELEKIKEQQIVNDNFKDGKTVADEGQWSIVFGIMKKLTLFQRTIVFEMLGVMYGEGNIVSTNKFHAE